MVNSSSVPPSCGKCLGSGRSYTAHPHVNACGPGPGLGDSVLLVTFDFFHVFGKEISLWCCFDAEIDEGSQLLDGREGLVPAVPALGWAGTIQLPLL